MFNDADTINFYIDLDDEEELPQVWIEYADIPFGGTLASFEVETFLTSYEGIRYPVAKFQMTGGNKQYANTGSNQKRQQLRLHVSATRKYKSAVYELNLFRYYGSVAEQVTRVMKE